MQSAECGVLARNVESKSWQSRWTAVYNGVPCLTILRWPIDGIADSPPSRRRCSGSRCECIRSTGPRRRLSRRRWPRGDGTGPHSRRPGPSWCGCWRFSAVLLAISYLVPLHRGADAVRHHPRQAAGRARLCPRAPGRIADRRNVAGLSDGVAGRRAERRAHQHAGSRATRLLPLSTRTRGRIPTEGQGSGVIMDAERLHPDEQSRRPRRQRHSGFAGRRPQGEGRRSSAATARPTWPC